MSDGAKTGTPISNQARFTISWRDAAYYVNIPNYNGGDVVPYKTSMTLEVRLKGALATIADKQLALTEALKVAGELAASVEHKGRDWVKECDRNRIAVGLDREKFLSALAALERIRKP